MKITVTFEVDEDLCKEMAETDDINEAISNELGWVSQSGICVESIEIHQKSEKEG